MKIKDLKQPYKALALVRQKEQKGNQNEDLRLRGNDSIFTWQRTKEGGYFWADVQEGNYPPIPPDSLKDIPLQVRWDSGERFRTKAITGAKLKNIHVFESGQVAYVYDYNEAYCCPSESYFLEYFEPIPSEPQTRWVNMYASDEVFTGKNETKKYFAGVYSGEKDNAADISVQQQLINSKWVNV